MADVDPDYVQHRERSETRCAARYGEVDERTPPPVCT